MLAEPQSILGEVKVVLPASKVVRREVYVKTAKGQSAVRKLVVWQTNKDALDRTLEAVPGALEVLNKNRTNIVDAFTSLTADAIEAAQQTFETANITEETPGLDLSKLARPTSTWTYMVHDNPLNDDTMSALSLPGVFR